MCSCCTLLELVDIRLRWRSLVSAISTEHATNYRDLNKCQIVNASILKVLNKSTEVRTEIFARQAANTIVGWVVQQIPHESAILCGVAWWVGCRCFHSIRAG